MNRRHFLHSTAALLALQASRSFALQPVLQKGFADDPFRLGVASGDPTPTGVVLWTRLATHPDQVAGGMGLDPVPVRWEIAETPAMTRVLQSGTVAAVPELGHSVHVEVEGLRPGRVYFYRFHAGSATSTIGKTKTAPAPGTLQDRTRFAFASCQHYEYGHFTAHRDMAAQDLDAVFFLGDYIYEYHLKHDQVRKHDLAELITLEDYRHQHAQYRTDPDLQANHAAHPWIVTFDDHEVENNWAGIYPEWSHPQPDFRARRSSAFQAYYENMPLRRSSLPLGDGISVYRNLPYGRLMNFTVLDTRQFRTRQPCGDDFKPSCDERLKPEATMMGADQEQWFQKTLDKSTATWNVVANQVMIAQLRLSQDKAPAQYNMDQWDGYPAARKRLTDFLAERKPNNPVFITGDFHQTWVGDLKQDFDRPESATVASELVGTSITSGGNGTVAGPHAAEILQVNPHLAYNNAKRGYFLCEATPARMTSQLRVVDRVTVNDASVSNAAAFAIDAGRPGVQKIT